MGCDMPASPEHLARLDHIDRCHKLRDRVRDVPVSEMTVELAAIAARLFLPPSSDDHLHKDRGDNVQAADKLEAWLERRDKMRKK